jgi:hypothetical protein
VGKGTTFAITLPTMGDSSSGRIKLSSRDESPTPSLIAAARSSRSSR